MAVALQHAAPAEVVLQVLGGYSVEAANPLLEATVVGVDILNVEGSVNDPDALLNIDGPMGKAGGTGNRLIDPSAIRAKNGILVNQGAQHGRDMVCVDLLQPEIGGLPAVVAYHQHRNALPLGAHPSAFSCGPGQFSLPLEGLQKEGLVGLDDPALVLRAVRGRRLKKAMAPAKRGVFIDTTALARLAHAHPLDQCLSIGQPLLTFAQVRQGRARERIAGLAASVAAQACQPMAAAPRS